MTWNTLVVPLETGWQCTLIPGPQYYDLMSWGRGFRNTSARQLYANAGRDNFSYSWNARPLSEVDTSELWEKGRVMQLADDRAAFARHFRPNWDLCTITGARALRDVQTFVRDSLNVAHWNLPTDNATVKKLLCDAVASDRLVPVVDREYRGAPRVAQPDPAPQRWPTSGGGGDYGYQPKVLTGSEFLALKRANGELPALDSFSGSVSATLNPLPDLGAPATADNRFGLPSFIESVATALTGGDGDDSGDDDIEGDDGGTFDGAPFGADSSADSTPFSDAQPLEYSEDTPVGNSFDIAKTPNQGDPGTWYTNPGSAQMRMYGDDGKPVVDFDFDHDHGQGVPHAHNWDTGVRGPGVPFSPL